MELLALRPSDHQCTGARTSCRVDAIWPWHNAWYSSDWRYQTVPYFSARKKTWHMVGSSKQTHPKIWPQFHYLVVIAQNWSMICEWQYSKVYLLHVIKWSITSVRMQAILTFWQHGDQGQSPAEQFMSHSFLNTWFCMKHTWPTSFLQAKTLLFYHIAPTSRNPESCFPLWQKHTN